MAADSKKEPKICVRCSYKAGENDKYCIQCGAPLTNYCSDEKGPISKGCKKINLPDAAYCAQCGQPTVFKQAGLIKGYME